MEDLSQLQLVAEPSAETNGNTGEEWLFIGVENDGLYLYFDKKTIHSEKDYIAIWVKAIPTKNSKSYLEIQELLKEVKMEYTGLGYVHQQWHIYIDSKTQFYYPC